MPKSHGAAAAASDNHSRNLLFLLLRRGTDGRGTPSPPSIALGIFLATLFLGAGVFNLPLEAQTVGLVPLLCMLAVVWLICLPLYLRVANLLGRPGQDVPSGGGDALGQAVAAAGARGAGSILAWLGVLVYVTCAALTYTTLGQESLEKLAQQVLRSSVGWFALGVAVAAPLAFLCVLPAKAVVWRRLARLSVVWAVGVALVALVNSVHPSWSNNRGHGNWLTVVAALITFVAGCIVASRAASTDEATKQAPGALEPGHKTAIVALKLQVGMMLVLVLVALWAVLSHGGHGVSTSALWPSKGFRLSALAGPAGVVLFALCATGVINVAGYPGMAEARFRRSVVVRALIVVGVVLVAWMIPAVLFIGHTGLRQLSQANTNTAIGLARVAAHGSVAATVLAVGGALATLIAVTNANTGFVSSLARESIGAGKALRPTFPLPGERALTVAGMVLAAIAAAANLGGGASLSALLRIGGIIGGGIIVIVLPVLAEHRPRRRPLCAVAAVAVAVGLGVWAMRVAVSSHVSALLTPVALIVAWLPAVATLFAALGVFRGPVPAETSPRRRPLARLLRVLALLAVVAAAVSGCAVSGTSSVSSSATTVAVSPPPAPQTIDLQEVADPTASDRNLFPAVKAALAGALRGWLAGTTAAGTTPVAGLRVGVSEVDSDSYSSAATLVSGAIPAVPGVAALPTGGASADLTDAALAIRRERAARSAAFVQASEAASRLATAVAALDPPGASCSDITDAFSAGRQSLSGTNMRLVVASDLANNCGGPLAGSFAGVQILVIDLCSQDAAQCLAGESQWRADLVRLGASPSLIAFVRLANAQQAINALISGGQ